MPVPEAAPNPAPDPAADLALLEAAAGEAAGLAMAAFGQPMAVREKPDGHGPVTEADLAVDRMLRARLMAARPGYGWLSEESEDDGSRLGADRVFIVDPIDGTRGFVAGQRAWGHSLAVAVAGVVVAAVVRLPALDLTYAAVRGQGARRNGAAIVAADRTEAEGARLLATSSQLDPAHWPGGLPRFERLFRPSIAYRLCLVADGHADAMLTFRDTWEWDLAAGDLIVREAGALVTDVSGRAHRYNAARPAVAGALAAGPALHGALLARLGRGDAAAVSRPA